MKDTASYQNHGNLHIQKKREAPRGAVGLGAALPHGQMPIPKAKAVAEKLSRDFCKSWCWGQNVEFSLRREEALGSSQLVHTDPERLTQDQEGTRNGPASRNWSPGSSWVISIPDWIQCSATSQKQRDIVPGGPQRRRKAPQATGVRETEINTNRINSHSALKGFRCA